MEEGYSGKAKPLINILSLHIQNIFLTLNIHIQGERKAHPIHYWTTRRTPDIFTSPSKMFSFTKKK